MILHHTFLILFGACLTVIGRADVGRSSRRHYLTSLFLFCLVLNTRKISSQLLKTFRISPPLLYFPPYFSGHQNRFVTFKNDYSLNEEKIEGRQIANFTSSHLLFTHTLIIIIIEPFNFPPLSTTTERRIPCYRRSRSNRIESR